MLTILFLVTIVILVHLFSIQFTQMSPLTNFCTILGFDSSLPWPLCKVTLAIMHYGVVVIRTAKTVDRVAAVFVEVACFALFGKKKYWKSISMPKYCAVN